jgi:hypothetical protein
MGSVVPRITLLALLVVGGMLSCKSAEVTPDKLAGTWVMSDSSREYLPPPLRKASARIILNVNGTFIASDLPLDGLLHDDPKLVKLVAGSGEWRIVSLDGRREVQIDFHVATQGIDQTPYGMQLYVSKSLPPMGLFYFLGDPDQGQRLEFEKR